MFEGRRKVYVRETRERFSVTVIAPSFTLTRQGLTHARASAMVLLASLGCSRKRILGNGARGRVRVRMGGASAKGTGIEWLALRMAGGDRPMLLKAPRLFKDKIISIDPGTRPGTYRMTLIDPSSDWQTEVEATQEALDAAVTLFTPYAH